MLNPTHVANFIAATGHTRLQCEALLLGMTIVSGEPTGWLWVRVQWRKWRLR